MEEQSKNLFEKLIFENEDKGEQYRLTLNEFRENHYISIRKYYLSYEGEWLPSSEGATIPANLFTTFALLEGLLEICSAAEGTEVIEEFLKSKVK